MDAHQETLPQAPGARARSSRSTTRTRTRCPKNEARKPARTRATSRRAPNGDVRTRARIARDVTPARRDGGRQTWFVDVIAFRNQAAALATCRKGQAVNVMGTLSMEARTKDGHTYQNFTVTADAVMGAATTRRTE